MKKIIISSIAAATLIAGTLTVMTMNNPQDTQTTQDNTSTSSPEPTQHVIDPETVIDTPEQVEAVVEAVVEAPVVQVEDKAVEPIEEVIVRQPSFDELVVKYKISGDHRLSELERLFNNRTRTAPGEDRFVQFMRQLGFDMTESRTIYNRDAVYNNWVESLKNNQGF